MINNIDIDKYSEKEKEIIVLHDILYLIRNSINNSTMKIIGDINHAEIRIDNDEVKEKFILNILELLSKPSFGPKKSDISDRAYIDYLENIVEKPSFGVDTKNDIFLLKRTVKNFKDWLGKEITIEKMYLPSIEKEIDLKIKRRDMFFIIGNTTKHTSNRLISVGERIKKILKNNNIDVGYSDTFELIDDFYTWLYHDKFSLYISVIAEFLNNIKFGIKNYLSFEIRWYSNRNNQLMLYKTWSKISEKYAIEVESYDSSESYGFDKSKKEILYFYYELLYNIKNAESYFKHFTLNEALKKTSLNS